MSGTKQSSLFGDEPARGGRGGEDGPPRGRGSAIGGRRTDSAAGRFLSPRPGDAAGSGPATDAGEGKGPARPLAERMRPRSVEEVAGHAALLAPGTFLGGMLRGTTPPRSLLLWGPPGSGKTTLARLLAGTSGYAFVPLSAVLSGVKDLREVLAAAEDRRRLTGRGTILFVDEIHRFHKGQQDAFLPHVESGAVVLVGATTENPSFEVNAPLLSRCRLVVLASLTDDDLAGVLDRALADAERGLGALGLSIDEVARALLAATGQGDARAALGALEVAADLASAAGTKRIDAAMAAEALQKKALRHDATGDSHYDVVSAFIKSMRASDVDASLYWLARMIEGGEDPLFIARRMVIFASEDVGLADPSALPLAVAARDAVHFVGMPEGRIPLAHAVAHLARAPKSNHAYLAVDAALEEVRRSGALPVPLHLRNAPTALMKKLGHGRDYAYPHDDPDKAARQRYLPEQLAGRRFFKPPGG